MILYSLIVCFMPRNGCCRFKMDLGEGQGALGSCAGFIQSLSAGCASGCGADRYIIAFTSLGFFAISGNKFLFLFLSPLFPGLQQRSSCILGIFLGLFFGLVFFGWRSDLPDSLSGARRSLRGCSGQSEPRERLSQQKKGPQNPRASPALRRPTPEVRQVPISFAGARSPFPCWRQRSQTPFFSSQPHGQVAGGGKVLKLIYLALIHFFFFSVNKQVRFFFTFTHWFSFVSLANGISEALLFKESTHSRVLPLKFVYRPKQKGRILYKTTSNLDFFFPKAY